MLPSFVTMIIHWFVSAFALWLTALLVPGFRLKNFGSALIASIIIGLANIFIGPVLHFLAFPITFLTFGLFVFVINAVILRICAGILRDFEITNWLSAIFGAMILAFFNALFRFFIL